MPNYYSSSVALEFSREMFLWSMFRIALFIIPRRSSKKYTSPIKEKECSSSVYFPPNV